MALDLLSKKAWTGNLERLYRHDLEGFIWILPWVFLQFEGKELTIPALEAWHTGDYAECSQAKREMLLELDRSNDIATTSWKAEWQLAISLLGWLLGEASKRATVPPSVPPVSYHARTQAGTHRVTLAIACMHGIVLFIHCKAFCSSYPWAV